MEFISVLADLGVETEYFESKGALIGAGCGQARLVEMEVVA
jgi:adenine C2-methylase RlmN of 23S rRNA A2503 and tRNA A37